MSVRCSAAAIACAFNVQLVDGETGNHLWAERFDPPLLRPLRLPASTLSEFSDQNSTAVLPLIATVGVYCGTANGPQLVEVVHRPCRCFLLKCAMEFLRVIAAQNAASSNWSTLLGEAGWHRADLAEARTRDGGLKL
jgi:hypothetical protein